MPLFNIYGLIIMLIIMIPNILFGIFNKNELSKYKNKKLEVLEQIGRVLSFVLMIVNIPFATLGYWFYKAEFIYILINSILCFLYCLFWIIYWNKNSITKSLLLSIIPSIIFIISGIILLNIPLIIMSILFSFCHITISYNNTIL